MLILVNSISYCDMEENKKHYELYQMSSLYSNVLASFTVSPAPAWNNLALVHLYDKSSCNLLCPVNIYDIIKTLVKHFNKPILVKLGENHWFNFISSCSDLEYNDRKIQNKTFKEEYDEVGFTLLDYFYVRSPYKKFRLISGYSESFNPGIIEKFNRRKRIIRDVIITLIGLILGSIISIIITIF